MTRDEVLQQFGRKSCIDSSGKRVEWIDNPWSRITEAMADRIVELMDKLSAVEVELDAADRDRAVAFDELAHVEQERNELREILLSQEQELGRVQRILAALREPSEAVMFAAEEAMDTASATDCVPGDWNTAWVLDAIRAAVAAAEKEINNTQENTNAY